MTDYNRLIDAETWDFIRATAALYPEDAVTLDMAGQRAVYDRMAAAFHRGRPAGITVEDRAFGGVPCRVYEPSGGAEGSVVYLHGGGFVVGGLDSHDDVCAEIAAGAGVRVISVDYRLAPEHLHPAAYEDALAATRAVAGVWPGPLVLAGDSAGGNLAAAVAHAARAGGPEVTGQVLIYPGLAARPGTGGSYATHAHAPMLTLADLVAYRGFRHGDGPGPEGDPTAAPLEDADFTGLPPTVAFAAQCDPLADDAVVYAARVRAAGGRAVAVVEPGMVHGYLRARGTVTRARESFARIVAAVGALARGSDFNPP
ncbi:MAG: alpha/beta hydrolase [Rubellimicrobium sp.]|nr:alpha/beta hydrolase [Rubellimicrobium sp.]